MDYYELNLQKKKEIEDGLLELLQRVPFQQITITDLARHLGMSRKSFYHYFPNREACLESLMDRMIQEAAIYVTVNAYPEYFLAYSQAAYVKNLEYWKSKSQFLNAIALNALDAVFLHRYIRYIMREDKTLHTLLSTTSVEFDEDILLFYASGQLSLLMRWCQRGFTPSVEEMAQKYCRLLHTPLIQTEEK